ncbi:hypothetical protein A2U01_0092543, partial [Trifolium medium]|nr:hypothetical protein [Trifolium medium]
SWDTIDEVADIRVGKELFVLKVIEEQWTGGRRRWLFKDSCGE